MLSRQENARTTCSVHSDRKCYSTNALLQTNCRWVVVAPFSSWSWLVLRFVFILANIESQNFEKWHKICGEKSWNIGLLPINFDFGVTTNQFNFIQIQYSFRLFGLPSFLHQLSPHIISNVYIVFTVLCFSAGDKHLQWAVMSFMNEIIIRRTEHETEQVFSVEPPFCFLLFKWCHFGSFVSLCEYSALMLRQEEARQKQRGVQRCDGESELYRFFLTTFQEYEVTGRWLPHEESLW